VNEGEVLDKFHDSAQAGNGQSGIMAQSGVEMWRQSGMVRIQRDYPLSTASGKILPSIYATPQSDSRIRD